MKNNLSQKRKYRIITITTFLLMFVVQMAIVNDKEYNRMLSKHSI